jgi:NitT/TauT family transport system substrate-binding protein
MAFAVMLLARPAAAQTSVRFSLDGPFEGPDAPYLIAQDKGYYQRHGVTMRIEAAASAMEPITRVASGAFQMGVADINLLMRWQDQNPGGAIKAVFIVYNRPPYAIVTRRSRGLAVPKDLEGKRLGVPAASASGAQWPLFAKLTDTDPAKVKIEAVGIAVREPMLAAGQIDAITAFAYRSYVDLKDRGVPVNDLVVWRMPDYGLLGYGNAIIVNEKFATENPQAVTGVLAALVRGLKDTIANPTAAIASVIQRNEVAKREVELERLRMALRENILTPDVRLNGFGGADTARMQAAIDQQALIYRFKTKPTPAQVFEGAFLPPAAERKLN